MTADCTRAKASLLRAFLLKRSYLEKHGGPSPNAANTPMALHALPPLPTARTMQPMVADAADLIPWVTSFGNS
ncbi:hypothetical protein MSG28_010238 [Choristoneura fumiferana]|uniref:Uncharacterized protein n=1 Tax=Choristoneura fumiferana TaxID=7141 RepID=A0ACC0KKX0_CHOFU|nr:hypothetical protein MSG28_010238 [Choristoneura fumiferana]